MALLIGSSTLDVGCGSCGSSGADAAGRGSVALVADKERDVYHVLAAGNLCLCGALSLKRGRICSTPETRLAWERSLLVLLQGVPALAQLPVEQVPRCQAKVQAQLPPHSTFLRLATALLDLAWTAEGPWSP